MEPSFFSPEWPIPVDYKVTKGVRGLTAGDLTVYGADGKLAFRVTAGDLSSSSNRVKTIYNSSGNSALSVVHQDDEWQGFRGNSRELKDSVFSVKKIFYSSFRADLEVSLADGSSEDVRLMFRMKGSPFRRSCTIYRDNSIVAQANPMYKLRTMVYSRYKFRLTVYPDTDHALVVAMLVVFFTGY